MTQLQILGISVSTDSQGRFSLNDLHKAAMAAGRATANHSPGQFLRNDGVRSFISALEGAMQNCTAVNAVMGGRNQGTYGVRLVVLRYAAWIDPAFEVQVYQAFDEMTRPVAVLPTFTRRELLTQLLDAEVKLETAKRDLPAPEIYGDQHEGTQVRKFDEFVQGTIEGPCVALMAPNFTDCWVKRLDIDRLGRKGMRRGEWSLPDLRPEDFIYVRVLAGRAIQPVKFVKILSLMSKDSRVADIIGSSVASLHSSLFNNRPKLK